MEKEKILSTINEKLGKTSLSERTISDYMNANLPAEGTEPNDAYWEKHTAILKSLGGNFSADVAAQVEDFKKNYKPSPSPNDPPKKDGENDLLRRIEQLEKQNADNAKNASAYALRAEATAKGKSLKVANEAMWADAVEAVEIGDKDTAEDVTAKAKRIYEHKLRRYMGEGAAPYGSSGRPGASKEAEKEAMARREEFMQQQRQSGRLPKKQ